MIGPSLKKRFESEKRGVAGLNWNWNWKRRGFGHGVLGRIAARVEEDNERAIIEAR